MSLRARRDVSDSTSLMLAIRQVAHDYFENAMAFFTDTIYNAIMVSVSGGDISPLVGHNAFLRWSAVKEVSAISLAHAA